MSGKTLLSLYMILFSFIGGFADASSFVVSGVFTGHLTGNFVLSTVYAVTQNYHLLGFSIIALIGFISGTTLGSWFRIKKEILIAYKTSIALIFQLTIIVFIFFVNIYFNNNISHIIFLGGLSFALGLQNGTIHSFHKMNIHSTYVTGMTTSLINNLLSLQQNDPDHAQKSALYKIQFLMILAFVTGALTGAACIHFMQFFGFSVLVILLLITIILSIYLQHHDFI